MRLFISINLPEELYSYLEELQNKIKPREGRLNFTKHPHATLKFLGEIDEDLLKKVKERLEVVMQNKFTGFLGQIGVFPNYDQLRVIWVGVGPRKKVIDLQKEIDKALNGLFDEERNFEPHITLARVKFVKAKTAYKSILEKIKVDAKAFKIESFSLMESKTENGELVYKEIAKYELI